MDIQKVYVPDAIGEFDKLTDIVMGESSSVSSASSESSVTEPPGGEEPAGDPSPGLQLGKTHRFAA